MAQDLLIDVSRLVGRRLRHRLPTGIDRVALAYLARYGDRARALVAIGTRPFVLPRAPSRRLFEVLLAEQAVPLADLLTAALRGALGRVAGRQEVAGQWLMNTGHTKLDRPGYASMVSGLGVRPLYLIHDLIPLTHPQFCRDGESARHAARMRCALTTGAALVCNSRATFDALADHAVTTGRRLPPTAVAPLAAPLGADAVARAQVATPPLPRPYFVMLGTVEPRKNHLLALQIWQRLAHRLGDAAPALVLIGQQGWECEHVQRFLERTPGLAAHVIRPSHCDDTDVQRWLAHARALLFPSFAEGFGLPIVEALQLGTPVLASDLPVFREFAGDVPEYLDPLDAAAWMDAVLAYRLPQGRRRERRVEAARAWQPPAWDAHFAQVDTLMRQVDARAPAPLLEPERPPRAIASGHV